MKSAWKSALMKFVLNSLGSLDQKEFDAWIREEYEIAPLLEAPLRNLAPYRDTVIRELYQISPSEIFDVWRSEHPEILFPEQDVVIVRIGQELMGIRKIILSLETTADAPEKSPS